MSQAGSGGALQGYVTNADPGDPVSQCLGTLSAVSDSVRKGVVDAFGGALFAARVVVAAPVEGPVFLTGLTGVGAWQLATNWNKMTPDQKIEAGSAIAAGGYMGRAIVKGGAAASKTMTVPNLTPGPGGKMLGEAIGILKTTPPGRRVDMFDALANQIKTNATDTWGFNKAPLEGGGTMFGAVSKPDAIIFDAQGKMYKADFSKIGGPDAQFSFGSGGSLIGNYGNMRPLQ